MTRIPQARENPYQPEPVTLAQRRAARDRESDPWGDRKRSREIRGPVARTLPSHVYLVDSGIGLIKIGIAFDVELRLDQLAAGSPVPLRVIGWVNLGGRPLERALHMALKKQRSHGEWFRASPGEIAAIAASLGFQVRWVS